MGNGNHKPPAEKPPADGTRTSESRKMDLELARSALEKRRQGKQPTHREAVALRRVEKQRDDQAREEHYRSIPKKTWAQFSGRQQKVLNEQASRYGLPIGGATIDLEAVCVWIHTLLVEHGETIHAAKQGRVAKSDLQHQREQLKLDRERMAFEQEAGKLVDREELVAGLGRLAKLLREAGQNLLTTCGVEAHAILEETLDDFSNQMKQLNLEPPAAEEINHET